ARFSITTDNYTGYKLLIAGTNDTRELVNSASGTALESITTAMDAGVFGGDTATAFNGKWGYKPSKLNSTTNTNFLPAPTTSNLDTLDETDSANSTANNYIIALGARADYSTVPGTYTNTFVLTAVANNIPYTVNFNDNTEDSTVANLPATISGDTTSTSVALPTTIPTRTGYTFAGWCDTVTTINANGTTACSGTVYPASTTTTTSYLDFIDQTASSNIANLYAMWNIESYTITITNSNTTSGANSLTIPFNGSATVSVTPVSGYYLSNVSCPSGYTCTGYNTGSSYTGQQTVTITNNGTTAGGTLAFTGTASAYCTASDSNCMQYSDTYKSCGNTLMDARDGNTYSTSAIGNLCYMTKNLDLAGGTTLTSTLSNVSSDYTLPASSASGFSSGSTAYVYNSNSTTCASGSPCYSYYSYAAATAGTNPSSGAATSDICPKGWRLPTQAEFSTLRSSYYTGSELTGSPFLAVYGGYYVASSFGGGGSSGWYWSSTARVSSDAYYLDFFSNSSNVGSGDKMYGFSVRCVRQTAVTALEKGTITMQEVDSTIVSAMATNTQYTFIDSRDNQSYTAAKLGDGKVWMTKNLAIGCNGDNRRDVSLSSANSNVSSYTINTTNVGNLTADTSGSYTQAYMQCNVTYGAWYNYMAATAGTISGNSNSTNATSDICPKGWRLPTHAEQQAITSYRSAFSPVTGGFYYEGSLKFTGVGYWWSSTADNVRSRYILRYDGSSLYTVSYDRGSGLYVRCVKDSTMQDFTASDAAAMATGEARILKDSRDSQNYTVAKLPDGKVWMTQNLNLAGGTTLTSSTSNVTSNYTLPASSTSGFSSDSTAYVYNSGSTTCSSSSPCYSYYSYVAATAGTNPSSGAATSDICPKGWRLPTQSEFNTLTSSYSTGSALTGLPFLAVYAGDHEASSFYDGGSGGYYWSSTAYGSSYAYGLYFDSGSADVHYDYNKRDGFSVRCVKS
ncbi:DUF1566 domain-containing protein, partial [Candidatus Saccharibacteria bacterium]|nr:DUF1566 domain-containing protein [Candidatus Saccharibacteria bacterium]